MIQRPCQTSLLVYLGHDVREKQFDVWFEQGVDSNDLIGHTFELVHQRGRAKVVGERFRPMDQDGEIIQQEIRSLFLVEENSSGGQGLRVNSQ